MATEALLQNWERVSYTSAAGRAVDFLRVMVLMEAKGNGRGVRGLVSREWMVKGKLADEVQAKLERLSPLSAIQADIDIEETSYKGIPRVTRNVQSFQVIA